MASDPTALPAAFNLSDSQCRLYFHRYTHPISYEPNAGNHIISALAADGLNFIEEPGVRIAQESERETFAVYAPEVIRCGDGSYRMYYLDKTRDALPRLGRPFRLQYGLRTLRHRIAGRPGSPVLRSPRHTGALPHPLRNITRLTSVPSLLIALRYMEN